MKYFVPPLVLVISLLAMPAFSDTVSDYGDMGGGADSTFSIEFYTDANVLHGAEGFSFTDVDPRTTFVQADGRTSGDGKSDNGVVVLSNLNQIWYLKMEASTISGFNLANFKYYMGQPWNRTLGAPADGSFAAPNWYSVPTAPSTIYTAGPNDMNNLLYGTLATFSYAINPTGMTGGVIYNMSVTFTVSLTA